MRFEFTAADVMTFQDRYTREWHRGPVAWDGEEGFWQLVAREHAWNFELWHHEDQARRTDVPPDHVVNAKRNIDRCNQARNDFIEQMDEALVRIWPWAAEASDLPANTETLGSVVDRLSIASLRLFHMEEEIALSADDPEHQAVWRTKLETKRRQRQDLADAFDHLLGEVRERRKRILVYRQFKMYNDPTVRSNRA